MENKNHFQDYLFLLRKRLWLILACLVVTLSMAIFYNYSQTPIYQAISIIEIHENKNKILLPNQRNYSYQDYAGKQRAFETHFKILKSYPIIGQVVNRLKLEKFYRQQNKKPQGIKAMMVNLNLFVQSLLDRVFVQQHKEEESGNAEQISTFNPIISSVQGAVTISPISDTNLANISCRHSDPVIAVRIVNTLAEIYKDHIDRKQLDTNRENFNWITLEIKRLKKKLDHSENELHKYKEKSKILSMEMDKDIEAQEFSKIRSEFINTQTRRSEFQSQIKELENIIAQNQRYVPAFIESEVIGNISNELVNEQLGLNKLYKTYKHKHPRIIKAKAHIATLEKQFNKELAKIAGGMQSQIKVLVSKEKNLLLGQDKYRERIIHSIPQNIQFSRLNKETQTNTELYNYLMKQLKSLDIQEKVKEQGISIVEQAKLPTTPIRPRKRMNLIMGAISGFLLGISLALFSEYMDQSIKGVEDIEKLLELPILGVIPRFTKENI